MYRNPVSFSENLVNIFAAPVFTVRPLLLSRSMSYEVLVTAGVAWLVSLVVLIASFVCVACIACIVCIACITCIACVAWIELLALLASLASLVLLLACIVYIIACVVWLVLLALFILLASFALFVLLELIAKVWMWKHTAALILSHWCSWSKICWRLSFGILRKLKSKSFAVIWLHRIKVSLYKISIKTISVVMHELSSLLL